MSVPEDEFALHLEAYGLDYVREHRFHPVRRWRFDFAMPDKMVAIEVEGGGFVQGRHTRGVGHEKDCEKYSTAAAMGWRVLKFTPRQIRKGFAIDTTLEAIERR